MDILDDGEVVIQHLVEVKSGSKRIVDVFRVSSDGQKVHSLTGSTDVIRPSFREDYLLPARSTAIRFVHGE